MPRLRASDLFEVCLVEPEHASASSPAPAPASHASTLEAKAPTAVCELASRESFGARGTRGLDVCKVVRAQRHPVARERENST